MTSITTRTYNVRSRAGSKGRLVFELTLDYKEYQTGKASKPLKGHLIDTRQGHLEAGAKVYLKLYGVSDWSNEEKLFGETIFEHWEHSGKGGSWTQSRAGLFQGENLGRMKATGQTEKWKSKFVARAEEKFDKLATGKKGAEIASKNGWNVQLE